VGDVSLHQSDAAMLLICRINCSSSQHTLGDIYTDDASTLAETRGQKWEVLARTACKIKYDISLLYSQILKPFPAKREIDGEKYGVVQRGQIVI
jgi:hypothetical protein